MKILVIEDDIDIASNVGLYFEQLGHQLDFAYNGILGLELALDGNFDVIILDLMLPGMDGIEVCRQLRDRQLNYTPVIMLTARDTLDDKDDGFSAGADDYLVKPFSLRELNLRVNALSRRQYAETGKVLSKSGLILDPKTREVTRDGLPIQLKPRGFAILKYLLEHQGEVVSRRQLIDAIWADDVPEGDPLRVHVHHLRQQLDQPFDHPLIHTVHGVGYKLKSLS
jgi:DNA-binding response OmpR family regulator